MIQIELYRSLATNNRTGIEQDFTRMWKDITIQSSNNVGVKYDWSYHFHGTQLLSGAYGQAWAQNYLCVDSIIGAQLITKANIVLSNDTRVQMLNLANRREDQKAEHSGQDVLNLYTSQTYDYDNIFPLLNRKALNAMMNTITHNLTATRSWHFYDDVIIALAIDLTLITQTTGWTILANRLLPIGQITVGFFNETTVKLSDGNHSFPFVKERTFNIQWIHIGHSNIGYLLHSQSQYASLGIVCGNKTGNYLEIDPFSETDTARVLTIWIDHGAELFVLDYNHMILPDVSRASMPMLFKQYGDEQVFSCMSTNHQFHGTI
ncbi:unnamed protein product [Adineta ricciae]|uniref:Polysaccharide lyase family 8 central domain-containing protein n=1 Tax=Adineta ricciae TaxID=249248 RepID=A0A815RES1_ADIRI|nr:unnamed protein product [Adineta ricciae]